jgi:hypothetical protein
MLCFERKWKPIEEDWGTPCPECEGMKSITKDDEFIYDRSIYKASHLIQKGNI